MTNIINELEALISRETKLKEQIEPLTETLPGKSFRTKHNQGYLRYMYKEKDRVHYLGKNRQDFVKALEHKHYSIKLLRTLKKNIAVLEKTVRALKMYKSPQDVFSSIPEYKRHLIKPYQFQNSKIKALLKEYGPGSFYDTESLRTDYFGTRNRTTKSGYRVRSKAEEDIADAAYERGMFFLYEKDLTLKTARGLQTIHPDFAFYNVFTDSFIYLEHFGKIDDPDYSAKNFPRLGDYLANGYTLNENLFITLEGEGVRFTKKEIDSVLDKI